MTEEELENAMAHLGVDRFTARALTALPLAQVAWADGSVHAREREVIMRTADEQLGIGEEGALLLVDWLKYRPSKAYFELGLQTLSALSSHPDFGPFERDKLLDAARLVAQAAGGLFGFYSISGEEAKTIENIASFISKDRPKPKASTPVPQPQTQRMTMLMSTQETLTGVLIYEVHGTRHKHEVSRDGLTVGTSDECGVTVAQPGVKAKHCRLLLRRRKFYVEEEDGPVYLNGERIGQRRLLGGERIHIGDAQLTFKMGKGGM